MSHSFSVSFQTLVLMHPEALICLLCMLASAAVATMRRQPKHWLLVIAFGLLLAPSIVLFSSVRQFEPEDDSRLVFARRLAPAAFVCFALFVSFPLFHERRNV
jgi:succinate dehydrogenase hydrophobic anchor subunit